MLRDNEQLHIDLAGFDDSPHRPYRNRRRGMLILSLFLLVAVILVFARYRQLFRDTLSSQFAPEQTTSGKVSEGRQDINPTPSRKNSSRHKQQSKFLSESPMAEISVQKVVPAPLHIDVTYPGGQHKTFVARESAIHLDLQHETGQPATPSKVDTASAVINASERVSRPVRGMEDVMPPPKYPLLAQQMKVQGSVVLLAQVGKDGSVESLRAVSGPDILASAALEAVKRWHFTPAYKAGRPVSPETRITVNFIISTP
jgi:TonB family protein